MGGGYPQTIACSNLTSLWKSSMSGTAPPWTCASRKPNPDQKLILHDFQVCFCWPFFFVSLAFSCRFQVPEIFGGMYSCKVWKLMEKNFNLEFLWSWNHEIVSADKKTMAASPPSVWNWLPLPKHVNDNLRSLADGGQLDFIRSYFDFQSSYIGVLLLKPANKWCCWSGLAIITWASTLKKLEKPCITQWTCIPVNL